MSRALTRAFHRAVALQRVLRRGPAVPAALPAKPGVTRHPAAVAPVLVQPISILRPLPEDPMSLRAGVLEQFPPAARRLAR